MAGCPKDQLADQPTRNPASNYLPQFRTICILDSFNTTSMATTYFETFDSWKNQKPQLYIVEHTPGTNASVAYGPGWIVKSQDPTIAGIVVSILGYGQIVDLPA